jgi:hypothetical protein
MAIDLTELLKERDGVLLGRAAEIQQFLGMFTVPLFFFHRKAEPGGVTGYGSAVLVKLADRFFALTAGHCVLDAGDGEIVMLITEHRHRFVPHLVAVGLGLAHGTERDFGFWEISPIDAKVIQANNRQFLAERRIEVMLEKDCVARNDWVIVGGYPGAMQVGNLQGEVGVRLLGYTTVMAGQGVAPASPTARTYSEIGAIDLWLPDDGNVKAEGIEFNPIDLPDLAGA